jgi:hypothetical protein
MTDQQLTIQAMSAAQRILEEYLEPRPHNHEGFLIAWLRYWRVPTSSLQLIA